MESFVKKLQIEVQLKLDEVEPKLSPVKGYDQKVKLLQDAIKELKYYLTTNPFPDKSTEVRYFKHWLLWFYKLHFYFNSLYRLECIRITCSNEEFCTYLGEERKRIANFLNEHRELYFYYILGQTAEDELKFLRTPFRDAKDFLTRDHNFCICSLILSELLAYEDYKKIIDDEIRLCGELEKNMDSDKLKFIGTKSEAVELITLLYEAKLFDNTLDELIESFEDNTDIDLKDFTIIDNNNRNRKKSVNPLLDKFIRTARNRITRLNP